MDAIGYWLFRSKDFTTRLLTGLKDKMDSLWIEISLQSSQTWRQVPVDLKKPDNNQNIQEYISVDIHEERNKIKLIFKESVKTWLVGSDNRIERELMYLVFQAIRDFKKDKVGDCAQLQSNEEIREAINLYIPNGIRTMILIMPLLDPRYDDRSLPEVRLAQESDEVDVSKAIRIYLISKSLNNYHPNSKDEKIKFIQDIVEHLYVEFTKNVSLLAPSGVLDFLLAQHEAIVQNNFVRRLQIPAKLASFYSTPELIKELEADTPDNTRTSIALRFIVEYVAACPPKGLKTMSYETYDRLIALVSEIILLGTISDLIFYNIDEIDLEVKFGFLNIHQKSFFNAFERFTPNYFDQVIRRSVERFNLPWQRPQDARSEEKQNNLDKLFDEGFVAEFGYTYAEYMKLCVHMVIIGEKQNSPAKYFSLKQLVKLISEETIIPSDKVLHIIESLTLKERNNFLIQPSGYEKWEVYPWKVNRRLSFLRKPLIKLTWPEEGILWGSRHLFNSVEFIHDLSYSGQLFAKSHKMKNFKSIIRNQDGEAFNDEVYDVFNKHSELIVRKRVEKIQGSKMHDSRGELGDIDVFVLNKTKKDILIIECKNLNAAISPIEYDSELRDLFVDGEKDCEATKLQRRLQWIEQHAELVAKDIRSPSFRGCSYHPLIVTNDELFTPYLNSSSVPTLSIKRLVSEYLPNWIQINPVG